MYALYVRSEGLFGRKCIVQLEKRWLKSNTAHFGLNKVVTEALIYLLVNSLEKLGPFFRHSPLFSSFPVNANTELTACCVLPVPGIKTQRLQYYHISLPFIGRFYHMKKLQEVLAFAETA